MCVKTTDTTPTEAQSLVLMRNLIRTAGTELLVLPGCWCSRT